MESIFTAPHICAIHPRLKEVEVFLHYPDKRIWKFLVASGDYNENEIGEFLGKVRNIRNSADYDKNHDYEYFLNELNNINSKIDDVVDSVNYLRNNTVRL